MLVSQTKQFYNYFLHLSVQKLHTGFFITVPRVKAHDTCIWVQITPSPKCCPQLHRTGNSSLQSGIFNAVVKRQCRYQTSIALLDNDISWYALLASAFVLKFPPCSLGKKGSCLVLKPLSLILYFIILTVQAWPRGGSLRPQYQTQSEPQDTTPDVLFAYTQGIMVWKIRGTCHGQLFTHCIHILGAGYEHFGMRQRFSTVLLA